MERRMKERSVTADVLKGLAVLFMIQVHITEVIADTSIYNSWIGKISLFLGGPPAAPVFMTVMGYFLAASSKNLQHTVLRGLKLIAGGIALNIAINAHLLYHIATGQSTVNPLDFIFGIDILVLAGVTTVFIGLLKKILDNNFLIPSGLAIVVLLLTPSVNSWLNGGSKTMAYFASVLGGDAPWSYFPLFPWAAYPLFGYAAYLLIKSEFAEKYLTNKVSWFLIAVWAVFVSLTIEYGIETAAALRSYYHHGIEYAAWALAFTAGFAILINEAVKHAKENAFLEYFALIGRNVTLAYVVQWVIIGNIGSGVYRTVGLRDSYIALVAVVFVTSILIMAYENRTRLRSLFI